MLVTCLKTLSMNKIQWNIIVILNGRNAESSHFHILLCGDKNQILANFLLRKTLILQENDSAYFYSSGRSVP